MRPVDCGVSGRRPDSDNKRKRIKTKSMNLYLLRHGIAAEPGVAGYEPDSERPLTPKGEGRLREAARAMKALDLSYDLILSSPFLRAKQTAEIIAKSLKLRKKLAFSDDLTPAGNPRL